MCVHLFGHVLKMCQNDNKFSIEVNDHLEGNEEQRFVGEICTSQCPHTI